MGFIDYIEDHIWLPIVVIAALVAIIVLLIICLCRRYSHSRRYEYMPLLNRQEEGLGQKFRKENERKMTVCKDNAWMNCQYYMRQNHQYTEVTQQGEIGCRLGKYWFKVYDSTARTYKVLAMMKKEDKLSLPFTMATRRTLRDMLLLLNHPYICPISDIDFMVDQNLVVVVYPVFSRGSLKDYIYQSRCMDSWTVKYSSKSRGLNTTQIRCFGRQILEALLFLEEKGFPPHGHVHAGNVMLDNNCCRLMGSESLFLGQESRLYPLVRKKLKSNKDATDVISFGHLLYEMCAGRELDSAHPTPSDLNACKNPQVVQMLNFIFPEGKAEYPSLRQIAEDSFFSDASLPELERFQFAQISLSKEMRAVIKAVRKGKPAPKSTKKKQKPSFSGSTETLSRLNSAPSTSAAPAAPPPPPPPPGPPGPPAPPPPPPPPGPGAGAPPPPSSAGRSALLGSIRQGAKLKKTVTNDRSGPNL